MGKMMNKLFGNGPKSEEVKRSIEHHEKKLKQEDDDLAKEKKKEITDAENKQKAETLTSAYKKLFESKIGQLVLEDLKEQCFYNESCYDPDVKVMRYKLGLNQAIHIINKQLNDKG